LFAHTYYSLKYGTLSPAKLVEAAAAKGLKVLALADINNTSCGFDFIQQCKKHNIKPVLGIDFRQNNKQLYVGIARNEEGFKELCSFLTQHSLQNSKLPVVPPHMQNVYIIYTDPPKPIEQFKSYEFIGIRPENANKIYSSNWRNNIDKLIAYSPICFLDKLGYKTHKILRAIDLNTVFSKLDATEMAQSHDQLYSTTDLESFYENYPQLIENSNSLFDNCSIEIQADNNNNRQSFTGTKEDDMKLLVKFALNGATKRYKGSLYVNAMERINKELKIIKELGFAPYFLIIWDIIRYAQSAGYHHIGRGSGANSIVAYCLYITDVDPIELDLYFERFINPYRVSPPDFDIDFSWSERDDVIDYIFNRYGREHTALLATYNTFKTKSTLREIAKVVGLPKEDIDLIIREPFATDRHHPMGKTITKYAKLIEGFPNYLSIHAGGILISERPLNYHTALQLMPKGFPITHFDMYGAEDLQFHKYDILSQRGLGHIKDAVDLVKHTQHITIDIHDLEKIKNDEKVKAQLYSGHCIGCFYIESPAMRGLLSKLNCDNYVHLVAASSIIRPGVAQSGMMREYIYRFHNPHSFEYLHPIFEKYLGETFGVMVYQEDVMKIVHHFAGLDLDESDVLRRIMSGKRKQSDTFDRLEKKYYDNCKQRGYPEDLIAEVWRQVESFSGYSFCKAHSASYAAESFQSLYLKTYFPLEFIVAVINNFGGFYSTEYYFHEARMLGAFIHAPCINNSRYLTHLDDKDLYVGLIHLNGIEQKIAQHIVVEREENGPYKNLADFTNRIDIRSSQLDILIRIGAFRFAGLNKYETMWEKNSVYNSSVKVSEGLKMFSDTYEDYTLPVLVEGRYDQVFDEIELLGFPLSSPFDLVAELPTKSILASEMSVNQGKEVCILGYFVATKTVSTITKELMQFGTWVDQKGKFFDTTHFPRVYKMYPLKGKGVYYIKGKIVLDFGFPSIDVSWMSKLAYVSDERY